MAFLSNRALFVKNLSYNVTPEELFELFGKFGAIRYAVISFSPSSHFLPLFIAI